MVHLFYHAQPLERSHHRHAQGIHGDGLSGGHREHGGGDGPEVHCSPATNGTYAPTTSPLMITGQSGARFPRPPRADIQVSHAARVVAAVPNTTSTMPKGPTALAMKAPTARPGTASGHAMGSSVRASATLTWITPYEKGASSRHSPAYTAAMTAARATCLILGCTTIRYTLPHADGLCWDTGTSTTLVGRPRPVALKVKHCLLDLRTLGFRKRPPAV